MKPLRCEMCGSNDVVKQGGYYVCQCCETKYSIEEAKKMMIEGTVEVQGTVSIDNSSFVQKCLVNARRAKQKEDWEEVEKYYNLVEQNDPTNIEAIFYSSYGKARQSMVDGDIYKREQVCDSFCNSISIIDDNYSLDNSEMNQKIILQMNRDLFEMYGCAFVYTQTTDGYGFKSDNKNKTYFLFAKMAGNFIDSVKNIAEKDEQLVYWCILFDQYNYLVRNGGITKNYRRECQEKAEELREKILEKKPDLTLNEVNEIEGCYIATCVYNSYDCPQVWTLRRYRDDYLGVTWYGRLFIHIYYTVSPCLVKWFGVTRWFRTLWKHRLDCLIDRLSKQGIENTPYHDKNWRK